MSDELKPIVLFNGHTWDHGHIMVAVCGDQASIEIENFSFRVDKDLLFDLCHILHLSCDKLDALNEGNVDNLADADRRINERNAEMESEMRECDCCREEDQES